MAASGTTLTAFGTSDTIEGEQDIIYGLSGDITTESFNAYKDLLGEENYYKVEHWTETITGYLLLVDTMYQIGSGVIDAIAAKKLQEQSKRRL